MTTRKKVGFCSRVVFREKMELGLHEIIHNNNNKRRRKVFEVT